MNAHEARAVIGLPLQYGWKEGKFGLEVRKMSQLLQFAILCFPKNKYTRF
jgi:hypothetical protein